MKSTKVELRNKYLDRNPIFNFMLLSVDFMLSLFLHPAPQKHVSPPRRILLANGAHLGDVVISTSVLPVLKSAFPSAQIGFLVGSWSRMIVETNPLVDFVHVVDHWRLNRNQTGLLRRIRSYLRTRKVALLHIKEKRYDLAVDLYTCFPNSIPLLWQADIPVRIGYISSGFGPLLTHGINFVDERKHESQYQLDLLRALPIEKEHYAKQHSVLPNPSREEEKEVCNILSVDSLQGIRYRIVHMGTGLPAKEWPVESWRVLVEKLVKDNHLLLFTGVGQRENENIERAITGLPRCINACGKLSWRGYLAAVSHAELLYCTDSLAGHVAAALDTNCVVVYSGIVDPIRWRPQSGKCEVITNPVPCAPCHRQRGCQHMECIRGITPDQVYGAGNKLTARARVNNGTT